MFSSFSWTPFFEAIRRRFLSPFLFHLVTRQELAQRDTFFPHNKSHEIDSEGMPFTIGSESLRGTNSIRILSGMTERTGNSVGDTKGRKEGGNIQVWALIRYLLVSQSFMSSLASRGAPMNAESPNDHNRLFYWTIISSSLSLIALYIRLMKSGEGGRGIHGQRRQKGSGRDQDRIYQPRDMSPPIPCPDKSYRHTRVRQTDRGGSKSSLLAPLRYIPNCICMRERVFIIPLMMIMS